MWTPLTGGVLEGKLGGMVAGGPGGRGGPAWPPNRAWGGCGVLLEQQASRFRGRPEA